MGDYPDYTTLMQILGSDIMIPIDIQGAYIMMPVDIQAQYVTLDIDITAQSVGNIGIDIKAQTIGNIAVNIAASAITLNVAIASSVVTLNVDIKAQTLTDFKITVNAQNVGVYLQPEWAALQGIDKNFRLRVDDLTWQYAAKIEYVVPAGKKLYITGASFAIVAAAATDYDHHLYGEMTLWTDANTAVSSLGGVGGNGITFPKPLVIIAGAKFIAWLFNRSNITCDLYVSAWGYEV